MSGHPSKLYASSKNWPTQKKRKILTSVGFKVQTSRNWLRSNASILLTSVAQESAVFPQRLTLCFNRKAGDRAKITGIAQLQFLSLP